MADVHFSTNDREVAKLFVAYQLTRDMADSSEERLSADQVRQEFLANLKILREETHVEPVKHNIPASSGTRSAR